MRILLITGSFPPMKCGVGDYTACLARSLSTRETVRVAVITSDMNYVQDQHEAFEVFPIIKKWEFKEFSKIRSIISSWRPNVVHIQYPTQGYFGGGALPFLLPALLWLSGDRIVQTWHEYITKKMVNLLFAFQAAAPGPIIVVRPHYADHLSPFYRHIVKTDRIHFIPNASSLPRISLAGEERKRIRERYAPDASSLVSYFGFLYPHKGIDDLFAIADPTLHHLVLIGSFDEADPYHQSIKHRATRGDWAGKVTITGFLPSEAAARILAASDAVVLPFRDGGGLWNTSLHGAMLQGTFILTTSQEERGYDSDTNIFSAPPGDITLMQHALKTYAGKKNSEDNIDHQATWKSIADAHLQIYRTLIE